MTATKLRQKMRVRNATDSDRAEILHVHADAFGEEEGPEIVGLVADLLDDASAAPLFSLVAEADGHIAGHVLFTAARLHPESLSLSPSPSASISAQILCPLAVARKHQREGVGSALIDAGLQQLAAVGIDLVFVLGHPGYYPKFGFRPAGVLGFEATYPILPKNADAWMVQALKEGLIGELQGKVQCAATLDKAHYWQE